MPLHIDSRGLALTASLLSTPAMFDEAVNAYLGMRKDTLLRAAALTESDSACVLAHCFNGYLQMHACQSEGARRAQQSLDRAKEIARRSRVMPREEFHIAALESWWKGDLIGAVNSWETILAEFLFRSAGPAPGAVYDLLFGTQHGHQGLGCAGSAGLGPWPARIRVRSGLLRLRTRRGRGI